MSILRAHPVVATPPHSFGELLIAANDQSGVAGGAKIFRRIETETSGVADCSGFGRATLEWKLRADRLGGVFDQNQIMLARDRDHFIHVAAQTKKMGRNKGDNHLSVFVNEFAVDFVVE